MAWTFAVPVVGSELLQHFGRGLFGVAALGVATTAEERASLALAEDHRLATFFAVNARGHGLIGHNLADHRILSGSGRYSSVCTGRFHFEFRLSRLVCGECLQQLLLFVRLQRLERDAVAAAWISAATEPWSAFTTSQIDWLAAPLAGQVRGIRFRLGRHDVALLIQILDHVAFGVATAAEECAKSALALDHGAGAFWALVFGFFTHHRPAATIHWFCFFAIR